MTARLDLPLEAPAVQGPRRAAGRGTLLLGALVAVLALATMWWHSRALFQPGPVGGTYAVQLRSGQMYFGVLREAGALQLQLSDIYYVQAYTMPDGQPGNRVVNRQKNDWHGPTTMTIPLDSVMYVEAVGPQSQLARLIAQDQGTQGAQNPGVSPALQK